MTPSPIPSPTDAGRIDSILSGAVPFVERVRQLREQIRVRGGLHVGKAVAFATLSGAAWYAALIPLRGTYVSTLFCSRGWIPYVSTWLFFLCIGLLLLKLVQVRNEGKAHKSELCAALVSLVPRAWEGVPQVDDAVNEMVSGHPADRDLVLINRLRSGLHEISRGASPSEVSAALTEQASSDYHIAESSYFMVKFLIWVIPILGFLGTVIGVANAIGGFDKIITTSQSIEGIRKQMGGITDNLGIAFETTLIALIMSALMMLGFAVVQKREEDTLAVIDQLALERVLAGSRLAGNQQSPSFTPRMPSAGDPGILRDLLERLTHIEASHNAELEKLAVALRENASALGSAQQLAENLRASREAQARIDRTIERFNDVMSQYVGILRQLYRLSE